MEVEGVFLLGLRMQMYSVCVGEKGGVGAGREVTFVWVYSCYVFLFCFLPLFFGSGTTSGLGEFVVSF